MKKFKPDPTYFKPALYAFGVILCSLIAHKTLSGLDAILAFFGGLYKTVRAILSPFVYGFFIAYLINPLVCKIERFVMKFGFFAKKAKQARFLSALVSYAFVLGLIIWMISYLLPDVIESVTATYINAVNAINNSDSTFFNDILENFNSAFGLRYTYHDLLNMALAPLMQIMGNLPALANKILTGTLNAAGVLLNMLLGVIIAFYMTLEKEAFKAFIRRMLKLFWGKAESRVIFTARASNDMFEKFFIGKIVDSLCIGLIFNFLAVFLLKLKFPLFYSVIIGVTNVIPYFGPFIGGIPVAVIVMLSDFKLGLLTGLTIFILQQFDGNFLGPLILGDVTGLKPLDVIFAILVGGAAFGVAGMFFGVPVFAVVKIAINALINKQYDLKYPNEGSADGL